MSLYNILHGTNRIAPVLLAVLGIDQNGGEYQSGRFRDIYLNADGTQITLYTRNGGGNREEYQEVFDKLATHPCYVRDYDDDFDCTYAYVDFTIPEQCVALCKGFATGEDPKTIHEKFTATIDEMKAMTPDEIKGDPRFAPIAKVLDQIVTRANAT